MSRFYVRFELMSSYYSGLQLFLFWHLGGQGWKYSFLVFIITAFDYLDSKNLSILGLWGWDELQMFRPSLAILSTLTLKLLVVEDIHIYT